MSGQARRRKMPEDRRQEIVSLAGELIAEHGLNSLTFRRVALAVGVAPGLVSHYFPSAEQLAAEAFEFATLNEVRGLFGDINGQPDPLARIRALLARVLSDQRQSMALLILDAYRCSRNQPLLREALIRALGAWEAELAEIIRPGVASGVFATVDPLKSAIHILALVDSYASQVATHLTSRLEIIREMVVSGTERELGLAPGSLQSSASG
ncbi:TetR/AcrR family transcriptional regulator [Labrys neptuniae]